MAQPIDSDTLKLRALTPEHQLNQFFEHQTEPICFMRYKKSKNYQNFFENEYGANLLHFKLTIFYHLLK